jgi:hypothetical protein
LPPRIISEVSPPSSPPSANSENVILLGFI